MSGTRDFSGTNISQRRQNQNYSRNLYLNNTTGQRILTNPQNSEAGSSRFNTYIPGAQTEYFRGLLDGPKTVSIGGIVNIPPFPTVIPSNSVPSSPTITSINSNNQTLSVIFTIPTTDGDSPITDYEYSTDNGTNFTPAGTILSPITITGLTNGTTYDIIIRAINAVGNGQNSNMVQGTPVTTPSAPIIISATSGNAQITIAFIAGATGGSVITNYQYSINNGSTFTAFSPSVTSSPVTITGLTNGTTYDIIIRAINAVGNGQNSNMIQGTPVTTPSAPIITSATSGNAQVTIIFTAGATGGSVITNYQYSIDNGSTFTAFSPSVTSSPVTITGLTNGIPYSIQLKAINSIGTGSASETYTVTPVPVTSGLLLFLDGASGTSSKGTIWPDTSGNSNDCTLTASPSWSSSNSGYYIFNGSSQFGEVPDGFSNFTGGITILAFVNFGANNNNWERIIDFGNGDENNNIILARQGISSNLAFELYNGVSQPISFSETLTNGIINDQWIFVAARLSGTNYLIKNQSISTSGSSLVLPANITRTSNYIGKSNWFADSLFEGDMGILSIYNTALTDSQILNFYNIFGPRYGMIPYTAPIITSITGANQTLIINFTAGSNGGASITDYQYSLTGGTMPYTSGATTTSPIIISGLNNNQPYNVAIFAVNSLGPSPLSNVVTAIPIVTVNTFTAVGSTTWTAPTGISSVEYLVVGGGGGSGATHDGGSAGGGGAGMILTGTLSVTSGNTYSVIVGDGGAGGISYSSANPGPGGIRETDGISGENSEFASIIALGGGYGNKSRTNGTGTGGVAVTDPSTASTGGFGGSFNNGGGGGGGDSGAGSNGVLGVPRTGGAGGIGTASSISGVSVTYGVGGRGGNAQTVDIAQPGTANRGNGASGPGTGFASQRNGAKGGSGTVILRY
jgi:hypothetical protein